MYDGHVKIFPSHSKRTKKCINFSEQSLFYLYWSPKSKAFLNILCRDICFRNSELAFSAISRKACPNWRRYILFIFLFIKQGQQLQVFSSSWTSSGQHESRTAQYSGQVSMHKMRGVGGTQQFPGLSFRLWPFHYTSHWISWYLLLCKQVKKEINCSSCQTRWAQADSARGLALCPIHSAAPFQLQHDSWHNLMTPNAASLCCIISPTLGLPLESRSQAAGERQRGRKVEWHELCLNKGHIVLRRHVMLQQPWGLHNGLLLWDSCQL